MKKHFLLPILLLLLGSVYIFQPAPYQIMKLKTFDSLVKKHEPSGYFSLLSITEGDITREGGYPLSRQRLAEIHIELLERGAIGVGWVVAFPQEDRFGGDDQFAEALSYSPSVLAMFENEGSGYPPTTGTVILGEERGGIDSSGVIQNIGKLRENASQGIAVARVDVDSLVRRLPLLMKTPDGWVPSYATEVMKILAGADTYVIKTNESGIEEIRVKGLPPVKTDYNGRKWISWVDTPETDLKSMEVEGKFVFVGFTAKGIMPQIGVPNGKLLEPHKIQAALAESILIQDSPYIPEYSLTLEISIFLFSVLMVYVLLHVLGITLGLASFAVILISTAFYGVQIVQSGLLIDITWSLISQFITGTTAFYLRFRQQFKLRQQIKKQFEHYLDKRQIAILQKNPEKLCLGGERRYATFLFTDLRGFTNLSSRLEPEEVAWIMNKTLTVQVEAVQKFSGTIDKFIGDACMSLWSAPLDMEHHENRAIDCALEMLRNIEILNEELSKKGIEPVKIGIGINSGYAVIGNLGSETRFDYTAIGDPVNVAARLESATKDAGVDLLIGYNTAIKSDHILKKLPPIKVKGKDEELEVYTIYK